MNKEDNIKEKFKQALISTAKVISDDMLIKKNSDKNPLNKFDSIKVEELSEKKDFIRSRAEMDSSALKKRFSDNSIYQSNLPQNTTYLSLIHISEPTRPY